MRYLLFVLLFITACSNPYQQKLKIYEMDIAAGRDQALTQALELSQKERIAVEKQYIDKMAEDDMLFAGYISITGKSPEDIRKMPIYSMDVLDQYEKDKKEDLNRRTQEIDKAYGDLFKKIEGEDIKIKTIKKATEEITAERQQTYKEIVQMFGAAILSAGAGL